MSNAEILLEGSYLYYQGDINYSQENFKLVHMKDLHQYHIYAEVLSRIDTGEFLKFIVRFEMNSSFVPVFSRVEKSIGNRYAQETMNVEKETGEMKYLYQNHQGSQEFTRPYSAKHYMVTPAFSTSTIFTLTKKFDATGRTPVTFVGTNNEWEYLGPPDDRMVYIDFKSRDAAELKINETVLPAAQMLMYQHDSTSPHADQPVEVFISKHYGIPYQLQHGDHRIKVKNLKKNS